MKAGDKVVYIGDMEWTKIHCCREGIPVPDPNKVYTVDGVFDSLGSALITIRELPITNTDFNGWYIEYWRKIEPKFSNALTAELAEKQKHIDEEFAKEQKRELNPRIFTTKEEF